jgi:type I restriction enzyme M protein
MSSATIVQKLWNYCNVLRDDGMSYGDYVEQLTYLPFLKMADERLRLPFRLNLHWTRLVKPVVVLSLV